MRKSMHPSCPAESTLYKKRRRFITWNSKPASMISDLMKCKAVATKSREEFASLERDEERWAECFEIARHKLNSSLATCREKNNRLRAESKHLYELVVQECGPGLSVRKRRASQMRDILEELDDRQMQLEGSIEEYEKIALSSSTTANGNGAKDGESVKVNGTHTRVGRNLPTVHMTIDELDYPEDFGQYLTLQELEEAKKRASHSDVSGNIKISGVQSRRDVRAKKLKKSKLHAGNGDNEDKNTHLEIDEEEDSDGVGGEFGRGGNVAEFCAMFAAVDGSVRLGEASLADLDPFFSDDEGEDVTQQVTSKGSSKVSAQAKGSSASTKALTASQKAATLRAASTWDSYAEYQKECKLAEPFSLPKGKTEGRDTHWAQCVADASQCPDLVRSGSTHQSALVPRTRFARGAGSGAVNLSAFAVSRTPRGVPLIISPLSQYEDMYLGAVCGALTGAGSNVGALQNVGGDPLVAAVTADSITPVAVPSPVAISKGSSEKDKDKDKDKDKKVNINCTSGVIKDEIARLMKQDAVAVHVTVQLPANLIAAEDAAMERCRLQSLAAAAENKIKRLRASNIEWCRQAFETGQSLQRSKALFSQAHKDDLMESKIIRRELITYGIVAPKDTDPPLSPVGEYAPHAVAHGVGKGKGGGGPVNRKGVRSVRGLNFAVANAALLSNSPTPPLVGTFPGNIVAVDSHIEVPIAMGFTEAAGIDEEGGSFVDDVSIADLEEIEVGGDNDANTISHSSSQDTAVLHRGGKERVKSKVVKSKSVLRVKEEDTDARIDSVGVTTHFEDEELGVGDSMSTADSPMNNGAKKRGAAKVNPVGSGVVSETAGAANQKRRGNGSNGGAARKR